MKFQTIILSFLGASVVASTPLNLGDLMKSKQPLNRDSHRQNEVDNGLRSFVEAGVKAKSLYKAGKLVKLMGAQNGHSPAEEVRSLNSKGSVDFTKMAADFYRKSINHDNINNQKRNQVGDTINGADETFKAVGDKAKEFWDNATNFVTNLFNPNKNDQKKDESKKDEKKDEPKKDEKKDESKPSPSTENTNNQKRNQVGDTVNSVDKTIKDVGDKAKEFWNNATNFVTNLFNPNKNDQKKDEPKDDEKKDEPKKDENKGTENSKRDAKFEAVSHKVLKFLDQSEVKDNVKRAFKLAKTLLA